MKLVSLIQPNRVLVNARAATYAEAKVTLLARLAEDIGLDTRPLLDALAERETLGTTVIAPGIGVPHARTPLVNDFHLLIGCFPGGVEAPGQEEPVRLILLFLMPECKSNLYLRALSAFVRILSTPAQLDALVQAPDPDAFLGIVSASGVLVKDVVTASDIMSREPPRLTPSDTLRDAADMMIKHRRPLLPVVDDAGTYLGAVRADALLKVGLPDYLLQMDSVGFLTSFEPFQDLLKTEQQMTVRQIMRDDVPVFQEHTPMIIVAGTLVRKEVPDGIVVRERTLVGLISTLDFVHKVVRV